MRLTCPNCEAQYEIESALLPAEGRDVECSACGGVWFQPGAVPEPAAESTPPPPSRKLDESVLAVLREEAARELRARENERLKRRKAKELPPRRRTSAEVAPPAQPPAMPPTTDWPAITITDADEAPALRTSPVAGSESQDAPVGGPPSQAIPAAVSATSPAQAADRPVARQTPDEDVTAIAAKPSATAQPTGPALPLTKAQQPAARATAENGQGDGPARATPTASAPASQPPARRPSYEDRADTTPISETPSSRLLRQAHRGTEGANPRTGTAQLPVRFTPPPRRGRYGMGFALGLAIAALIAALYLAAPRLSDQGWLGAALTRLHAEADQGRLWLHQQAGSLAGRD